MLKKTSTLVGALISVLTLHGGCVGEFGGGGDGAPRGAERKGFSMPEALMLTVVTKGGESTPPSNSTGGDGDYWGDSGNSGSDGDYWGDSGNSGSDGDYWGDSGNSGSDGDYWGDSGNSGSGGDYWGDSGNSGGDDYWGDDYGYDEGYGGGDGGFGDYGAYSTGNGQSFDYSEDSENTLFFPGEGRHGYAAGVLTGGAIIVCRLVCVAIARAVTKIIARYLLGYYRGVPIYADSEEAKRAYEQDPALFHKRLDEAAANTQNPAAAVAGVKYPPKPKGKNNCACSCQVGSKGSQGVAMGQDWGPKLKQQKCKQVYRGACRMAKQNLGQADIHHQSGKCVDGGGTRYIYKG